LLQKLLEKTLKDRKLNMSKKKKNMALPDVFSTNGPVMEN
jgi:hypothetical protein